MHRETAGEAARKKAVREARLIRNDLLKAHKVVKALFENELKVYQQQTLADLTRKVNDAISIFRTNVTELKRYQEEDHLNDWEKTHPSEAKAERKRRAKGGM